MRFALLLTSALFSPSLWAAACCGSSATLPALISGDDRIQLSAGFHFGQVVAEASENGQTTTRLANDRETQLNWKMDGAYLLSDRFQIGVSLPLTQRERVRDNDSARSFGVGDGQLYGAYELLPEWTYSEWRPKGFFFVTTTVPTGGSIYESSALYQVDARGTGFYSVGAGLLLLKSWGAWDASLLFEGHRRFPRTFERPSGTLRAAPGWGAASELGIGVSPGRGAFRLGARLAYIYEDAIELETSVRSFNAERFLWTPALQASYLVSSALSLNLSYSDQTWISHANNTGLSRAVSFLLQHRWER